VVARQPWRGLNAQQIDTWIAAVGAQLSANGQWRLLFSTPQLGPAAGLQALSSATEPSLQPLLEELTALERQQLQQEPNPGKLARQALIDQGWCVDQQSWQESLQLELSAALTARWLAPESTYLRQLNVLRGAPLPPAAIETLHQGFQRQLGQQLPQTVVHTLLRAQQP
jgi:putative ATPase